MKTMMKTALMTIMMVALSTATQAKDNDSKKPHMTREQLVEVQAKHIANKIALDDATTQKFVETFVAQQKEIWALWPKGKRDKDITEAEAEKRIKQQFEHSQKILDIRQNYYKKYSQFLTQKQILRVYSMEKKDMHQFAKHWKGPKDFNRNGKKRPGPQNASKKTN